MKSSLWLRTTCVELALAFAIKPAPDQRSPEYDIAERNTKLDPKVFPILRQSGAILFDRFDRRYREGLELILRGARVRRAD